jgi:hypothetical protein
MSSDSEEVVSLKVVSERAPDSKRINVAADAAPKGKRAVAVRESVGRLPDDSESEDEFGIKSSPTAQATRAMTFGQEMEQLKVKSEQSQAGQAQSQLPPNVDSMFAGSKPIPKTLPYKRRNQPAVDAAFQQANQAINQQQAQGFTAVPAQLPTMEPNLAHQLAVLTEAVQRLTNAQSKPAVPLQTNVERLEEQLLELTERVAQLAEAHRRDRLRRARDRLDCALQY